MAVSNIRDAVTAIDELGQFSMGNFARKLSGSPTWSSGIWADTTMWGGQPAASYYASAPLAFAPMSKSTHGGWDHGPSMAPKTKYLSRLANLLVWFTHSGIIVDVLGYYPFVDEATVNEWQDLDNTTPRTTRHGSGVGVKAHLVSVAPASLLAGSIGTRVTIRYTNSDGVPGRLSKPALLQYSVNANSAIMTAGTTHASGVFTTIGPFLPLQQGDVGIQSIEGVLVEGPGDTGLFTIVLTRPIVNMHPSNGLIQGDLSPIRSYTEHNFPRTLPKFPIIPDDAFMSCLLLTASSGTHNSVGNLHVDFDTFWG